MVMFSIPQSTGVDNNKCPEIWEIYDKFRLVVDITGQYIDDR